MKHSIASGTAAILLGLCLTGCAQVSSEKKLVATKDLGRVIGSLKWSVVEVSTGKVLSKGNKTFHLRDAFIGVRSGMGGISRSAYIPLGANFVLCRPEFPESSVDRITGFGLTLDRTNEHTFSWEWFTIKTSSHATKLQERGELGIVIGRVPEGYAITRTDFLTDVSMRCSRFDEAPGSVHWRAGIVKGSTINWPTIRNGQVVAN